jgi:hypothetical protein
MSIRYDVSTWRIRRELMSKASAQIRGGSHRGLVFLILLGGVLLFLSGCMTDPAVKVQMPKSGDYVPDTSCRNCHGKIYEQYSQSMHAVAYGNHVFQAQYFNELIPLAKGDSALLAEADRCIACHAPVASVKGAGHILSREEVSDNQSGVNCDFCHTLKGVKGEPPGSANYIPTPGEDKFGPFRHDTNWHHIYSEFQTQSEFCGLCHNDVNHNGLEIKSTYTEWKNSSYARKNIDCQNCHMNLLGFMIREQAAYESGRAATMTVGQAYWRNRLYSHWFPGAHDKSQLGSAVALSLNIATDRQEAAPGEVVHLTIDLGNEKVGHSMPSGSADLRLLWIELAVQVDNKIISIPAVSANGKDLYDISGKGKLDSDILREDVPEGSRIYRSIYVDKHGRQTLSSYNAMRIAFDNRLKADEVRKEHYSFTVPKDAKGLMTFTAMVKYLRYPSGFAAGLNIDKVAPVILSAATKELKIRY